MIKITRQRERKEANNYMSSVKFIIFTIKLGNNLLNGKQNNAVFRMFKNRISIENNNS